MKYLWLLLVLLFVVSYSLEVPFHMTEQNVDEVEIEKNDDTIDYVYDPYILYKKKSLSSKNRSFDFEAMINTKKWSALRENRPRAYVIKKLQGKLI